MKRVSKKDFIRFFSGITLFLTLIAVAGPARADSVTCTVAVDQYRIVDREDGQEVIAERFGSLRVPGKPKLPQKIFAIAIPPYTRMTSVRVTGADETFLEGRYAIEPAPFCRPIGRENPELLARDQKVWEANHDLIYGSDAPYPEDAGSFVRTAAYRKYNLVDVAVTPFHYRPLSGKLSFFPRIIIEVQYESMTGGYSLPLADFHPVTEKRAGEIILNYDQAAAWYPASPGGGGKALNDFVIITTASLEGSVASLAAWEETKGRSVEVVTVEWIAGQYSGPDQAAKIRSFLRDKYPTSEWGIQDVLVVGHHNNVAMRTGWVSLGYGRPRTDFYYAELSKPDNESWDKDGDGRYGEPGGDQIDFYSEINIGRIPWSDAATVQHISDKSVAFEQNEDPSFKKNILLLGAYFWSDTDNAVLMEAKVDQPWMSGWTMTRMYEKNSDYFSSYACDYELLRSNVVNVWSGGKFAFVNWAGHGSPTSCHIYGIGSPAFIQTSNCSSLNDNYPAIIFADACSNSDTDYTNIGAKMMQQGGVGFVGATQVALGCPGWNDPSDGSSQSLDYYFTTGVTSEDYTQGAAHQRAMLNLYTSGGWSDNHYETYQWSLWGNPDLGLAIVEEEPDDPIPLVAAPGPWGGNTAEVRVFDLREERSALAEFQAYNANKYGARVALGDLDDDGEHDIVTGPGAKAGFGPHVRAFSLYGVPIHQVSFLAYGTRKYGANVACGDVDGDGIAEILTGPGPGFVFGPHVRGWNYDGSQLTPIFPINFFAYGTRHFGANVACGDVDGDGKTEIITGVGPGPGFGPHVRGWNFENNNLTPMYSISYLAYPIRNYGVQVSAGDIAGDGNDEIITGPGPGALLGANVRAFTCESGPAQLIPAVNFMAYPNYKYGAMVSAGNTDDDGKDEMVTGPGPAYDHYAHVRGWRFDGSQVTVMPGIDFYAFDTASFRYGANVAVGQ